MEKELEGPIGTSKEMYKRVIDMAWPAVLESVLVGLTGVADTLMVSVLGTAPMAAVGLVTQPKFILLAVIMSLNVGVTAVVSRRAGEGDFDSANRCMRQCILLGTLLAALMSVLGYVFAEQILWFAGAEADTIVDATNYLRIIAVGQFFQSVSLIINAAQRGVGNTRIAMTTNVTANLVNILFNYLLITGHLGFPALAVRGAAIATALGQFIAFLMAMKSILDGHSRLYVHWGQSWKLEKRMMQSVCSVSSSSFVEQIFNRIGFLTFAIIVAKLGTEAFAAHQVSMNISSLTFNCVDGLSAASAALVGQALGARRPDLASINAKICQRIAFCFSVVLSLCLVIFGRVIAGWFTKDPVICQWIVEVLWTIAIFVYAQCSGAVWAGSLRGAGDTKFVALVSFCSIMAVRPLLGYLLAYPVGLGLLGAWIAIGIDQYTRFILTSWRMSTGKWKSIRL